MTLLQKPAKSFIPYGRQHIAETDIEAVVDCLRSDWLTQGPAVPEFERDLARRVGAAHAVACSNGTTALHLAVMSIGLKPGQAVITTPITFLADANCARYVGADVRFADIDPASGLINPRSVAELLDRDREHRIKAIIPVHFAGQPAHLPEIYRLARSHGARVIDDACHAIGATYEEDNETRRLGGSPDTDLTVFSFHPVKHVAMGEGGAVTTNDDGLAARMCLLRNHGMRKDSFVFEEYAYSADGSVNPWYYEMSEPGYNFRITDMQAALGRSQLTRLDWSLKRRNEIARQYNQRIRDVFAGGEVTPLDVRAHVSHAWHLYVVRIDFDRLGVSRATVMNRMRDAGIGTQVHYVPLHLQPYYRTHCGTGPGSLPGAEEYYRSALSLPMYPDLREDDVERILHALTDALGGGR